MATQTGEQAASANASNASTPHHLSPESTPTPPPPIAGVPRCAHCEATQTPLWRRNPDDPNTVLCNACGLFLKLKGTPRPLSLKTDVPRTRKRQKAADKAAAQAAAQAAAKADNGEGPSSNTPAKSAKGKSREETPGVEGIVEGSKRRPASPAGMKRTPSREGGGPAKKPRKSKYDIADLPAPKSILETLGIEPSPGYSGGRLSDPATLSRLLGGIPSTPPVPGSGTASPTPTYFSPSLEASTLQTSYIPPAPHSQTSGASVTSPAVSAPSLSSPPPPQQPPPYPEYSPPAPVPPYLPETSDEVRILRARVQELERSREEDAARIAELERKPPTSPLFDPDEAFERMREHRTEARIKRLCSNNRAGNRLCAWHDTRREKRVFPPRAAPAGFMSCGCTFEQTLFEETLARHGVGSLQPGEVTRMDPMLRNALLRLLQWRYNYKDGDFDRDPVTGAFIDAEDMGLSSERTGSGRPPPFASGSGPNLGHNSLPGSLSLLPLPPAGPPGTPSVASTSSQATSS